MDEIDVIGNLLRYWICDCAIPIGGVAIEGCNIASKNTYLSILFFVAFIINSETLDYLDVI